MDEPHVTRFRKAEEADEVVRMLREKGIWAVKQADGVCQTDAEGQHFHASTVWVAWSSETALQMLVGEAKEGA